MLFTALTLLNRQRRRKVLMYPSRSVFLYLPDGPHSDLTWRLGGAHFRSPALNYVETIPRNPIGQLGQGHDRVAPNDLRYSLRIAVWVRWFLVIAWLAQHNYRVSFEHPVYVAHTLLAVSLLALNAYVHYRIETGRPVTWRWALALSSLDMVMLTGGLAISGGFSNTFFVLYLRHPGNVRRGLHVTQAQLCWCNDNGCRVRDVESDGGTGPRLRSRRGEGPVHEDRLMYAVVAAVSLVSRFERFRRREAVERERELQRERIELSQTIHDTIAQSTYVIGLGLETAIELARGPQGART